MKDGNKEASSNSLQSTTKYVYELKPANGKSPFNYTSLTKDEEKGFFPRLSWVMTCDNDPGFLLNVDVVGKACSAKGKLESLLLDLLKEASESGNFVRKIPIAEDKENQYAFLIDSKKTIIGDLRVICDTHEVYDVSIIEKVVELVSYYCLRFSAHIINTTNNILVCSYNGQDIKDIRASLELKKPLVYKTPSNKFTINERLDNKSNQLINLYAISNRKELIESGTISQSSRPSKFVINDVRGIGWICSFDGAWPITLHPQHQGERRTVDFTVEINGDLILAGWIELGSGAMHIKQSTDKPISFIIEGEWSQ